MTKELLMDYLNYFKYEIINKVQEISGGPVDQSYDIVNGLVNFDTLKQNIISCEEDWEYGFIISDIKSAAQLYNIKLINMDITDEWYPIFRKRKIESIIKDI